VKILIAGASGLIGTALVDALVRDGHQVRILVRKPVDASNQVLWNPASGKIPDDALFNTDVVICLSGESVASYWSKSKKEKILRSRTESVQTLAKAISALPTSRPRLICASAIGIYGNRPGETLDESSPKGSGFLAEVCTQWEDAALPAKNVGTTVTHMRFGIVLSPKGGALQQMLLPFRLGLGAITGDGTQYMSWVSLDDVVRVILFLLSKPELAGAINIVSPNPATSKEFSKTLAKVLHRPCMFRIPSWMLKILLGKMADEMLLSNTRAVPKTLQSAGFIFKHTYLASTLKDLLDIAD
jgi:hypothetical protein